MVRSRRFHLVTLPTIFAVVFFIGATLLLRTPIFRLNLNTARAPFLLHTVAMSNTSTSTPNATSWIQSRLTALYEDVSVQEAFDRTFSPACELRLNHEVRPLQTFKDDLASRRAAATHVSVAWDAGIISTNDDKPEEVRCWRSDW